MIKHRFVKDTLFNRLDSLHEPKRGSALHQNVHLVLADSLYSTLTAPDQASSDHDVFCREYIQDVTKRIRNVLFSRAYGDSLFRRDVLSLQHGPPSVDGDCTGGED